ncbi:FUSC family protein [Pseudoxanthobacter sp. M-2]|uniref:FUSC family protein n=1 Tax=Pseudoxanthobacter sp. M-2 TaxID=3078754 RepID=UPI0038FCA225
MIGGERQALVAAAGCWLAAVLAFWTGTSDPWWACISAWVVANPNRDALVLKSGMRVAGTLIACIIGYNLALVLEGQPVAQALVLAMVCMVGIIMRYRSRFDYAWLLGAITIAMALVGSMTDPATLYEFVVYRGLEICIGVFAAMVASLVLGESLPEKPKGFEPGAAEERLKALHAAIIAGAALLTAMALWSWYDLPSILQIVVSILAVLDRDIAVMRAKSLQRVMGCLVGGSAGLVITATGVSSFFVWSILFVGGLMALAHLYHGRGGYSYVGLQGGFAFILAMVTGLGPPDTIDPIVERVAGMLIGVVILLAVVAILRPALTAHRAAVLAPSPPG